MLEGATRRLLVIDDEAALTHALSIVFRGVHDVAVETTAQRAIDRIVAKDESFDFILCDLSMPGKSGIEFYEEVRRNRPGLERRIIFMTGGAFTPRAAAFLAAIPNEAIEKPFEIEQINEALQRVIAGESGRDH